MWHRMIWFVLIQFYEQIDGRFAAIFGLVMLTITGFFVNYVLPYYKVVMLELHSRAILNEMSDSTTLGEME